MWEYNRKLIVLFSSPQFVKYVVVGMVTFGVDGGILYFLREILKFDPNIFGVISVDNMISSGIAFTLSFILNRLWSFQATHNSAVNQGGRFVLVVLFSYILHNILFGLLTIQLGIHFLIAKLTVMAGQMVWNFFLYKYVVFK